MKKTSIIFSIILVLLIGCASTQVIEKGSDKVELLDNLGSHHFPVSTADPLAQKYFDQGLILAYAFNHWESERAFRQAARIDPDCAMCYWGIAYALGPNINAAMEDSAVPPAYQAIQKSLQLAGKVTVKEKAYIEALSKRYGSQPITDRTALDAAYAAAMRNVFERFPDDPDGGALLADALMNQHPWDYWTGQGKPKPWAPEIVATLENVLSKAPLHPGANHFYIHAVEASDQPERALPSADRLAKLVPGSGHLVHMPAHIYIRTGRYNQAIEANRQAVSVDNHYLHHHHPEGVYPLAYVPHNHHFLWAAATQAGRSAEAIAAARSTATHVDAEAMRQPGMGTLEHYYAMPLYGLTRFGKWDELLDQAAPPEDLRYATAVWHYARGMALAAKENTSGADLERTELEKIAREPAIAKMTIWDMNTMRQILDIAEAVLAGTIAAKSGDLQAGITHYQKAVQLEDQLRYDEPSDWYHPVRQFLGSALLQAGRAAEAEQTYRDDLRKNPENGWSLFGLMKSLTAQNKAAEAGEVKQRFEKAWAHADLSLTDSLP